MLAYFCSNQITKKTYSSPCIYLTVFPLCVRYNSICAKKANNGSIFYSDHPVFPTVTRNKNTKIMASPRNNLVPSTFYFFLAPAPSVNCELCFQLPIYDAYHTTIFKNEYIVRYAIIKYNKTKYICSVGTIRTYPTNIYYYILFYNCLRCPSDSHDFGPV